MLKKSLSLLLVLVISLTAFGSLVSAAATAAPQAPADVEGATYLLKETFTSLPASGITGTTGTTSYTWQTNSNSSYDSTYNALAQKAVVKADFADITAAGDYVMSVDFMAPNPALGNGNVRIQLDESYRIAQFTSDGKLYLCGGNQIGTATAEHWYRLTANITLPSGAVTATLKDLTTGTDVGTKSVTSGGPTTITQFLFNFTNVTTNPLYTQNWRLYKVAEESGGDEGGEEGGETPTVTPAPNAPADVEGATYLLKESFNAVPTEGALVTNAAAPHYYWNSTANTTYDATAKALNHTKGYLYAFLCDAEKTKTPVTDDSSAYVVSIDFMFPDVSKISPKFRVRAMDNFKLIEANSEDGVLYLAQQKVSDNVSSTLNDNTWYRLTATIDLKTKSVSATITNPATGATVASKSTTNQYVTNIARIETDGAAYTQNWRLYKEYQKEYPVAPSAPDDVQGAQYIIKNDFTAVPNATDAFNRELTWDIVGNLNYNANYKALNHAAPLQGNFSSAVAARGKYTFRMDFMVDEPTTLTDAYNFQIDDFYVMSIAAETGKISLGGEETTVVVEDEKWYTVEAVMLVPDCTVDIKILDATDNSVVCSKSFNAIINFEDGISKIRLSNKTTKQTQLYTQSWRMYMLPHDFIAELNDGKITASYNSETEENAFIIIALYEGNSLKASSCKAYRNHTGLVTTSIDYIDGCNVKAFLWDPDSLAPFFHCIQDDDIRK